MKHVVVDLEMNSLPRRQRRMDGYGWPEIIEIGAVMLDEAYQEIDTFKTYVKPALTPEIRPEIQQLTGITTEMVADAPHFEEAWKMFFRWCIGADPECEVIAWSESDFHQVTREMDRKQYETTEEEKKFLAAWVDFQKEYDEVIGVERSTSLENAVMLTGRDFEGAQHDALVDARNTAELLRTVRDPERRKKDLGVVIEALEEKTFSASMGSFFDFSKLKLDE